MTNATKDITISEKSRPVWQTNRFTRSGKDPEINGTRSLFWQIGNSNYTAKVPILTSVGTFLFLKANLKQIPTIYVTILPLLYLQQN